MSSMIHNSAVISSGAVMGQNVTVEPFAVTEKGAVIGDNCVIQSHSVIKKWAKVASGVRIGNFSVVGGDPQHLNFDGDLSSFVSIGRNNRLGEGVTIHRSIYENKENSI